MQGQVGACRGVLTGGQGDRWVHTGGRWVPAGGMKMFGYMQWDRWVCAGGQASVCIETSG